MLNYRYNYTLFFVFMCHYKFLSIYILKKICHKCHKVKQTLYYQGFTLWRFLFLKNQKCHTPLENGLVMRF